MIVHEFETIDVEKNQGKISALVMDMLTFSKDREPDLTSANVNSVVQDVVELMQSRAQEEEVELCWNAATRSSELESRRTKTLVNYRGDCTMLRSAAR